MKQLKDVYVAGDEILRITSEVFRRSSAKQRKGWDHLDNFQTCLFSPGCEPWTAAVFLQPGSSVHATTHLSWQIPVPCSVSQASACVTFTLCSTGKKPSMLGETLAWMEISCWTHPAPKGRAHPIILTVSNVRTNLRIVFALLKGYCNLLTKN